MDDAGLVGLAAHGRVRFFPTDEFLAWQGEPHKTHLLVIQQGTVSLWDEQGGQAALRDVRGPGDWIGAEQFHGARSCLYTARANTDVVTYEFPVYDLEALLEKYPSAATFVASRSEEHTSELQSLAYLVCRLLLEKKKKTNTTFRYCSRRHTSTTSENNTPSLPAF